MNKRLPTCIAGEDLLVDVDFTYTPGRGPTGPTYASGGEPGYPSEIEVETIVLYRAVPREGQPGRFDAGEKLELPKWLEEALRRELEDSSYDELVEAAVEQSGPDPDEAYERAREARMEGRA